MKCSNAASVSSPGGGRGRCGVHLEHRWHSRAIEKPNPGNGIAGKVRSRVALNETG